MASGSLELFDIYIAEKFRGEVTRRRHIEWEIRREFSHFAELQTPFWYSCKPFMADGNAEIGILWPEYRHGI